MPVVSKRVAIVGAGVSGLAGACLLRDHGVEVTVFEKSRGTGGRASTHRRGIHAFDSGAQYFTARDPRFVAQVEEWLHAGVAAEWRASIVRLRAGQVDSSERSKDHRHSARFVGVPGMSAICQHLSESCPVQPGFHVARIEKLGSQMSLFSHAGQREDGFDAVMVTSPAPQAAGMIGPLAPGIASSASAVPFSACLALLLAFDQRLDLGFDGAFVDESELSWIAVDSSKPGRSGKSSLVLHASPSWSDENFKADEDRLIESLSRAFTIATGVSLDAPVYSRLHRWRYALPTEPLPGRHLFDAGNRIGVCGDWCGGPRVEGAYLSGVALAERLVQWFVDGEPTDA